MGKLCFYQNLNDLYDRARHDEPGHLNISIH